MAKREKVSGFESGFTSGIEHGDHLLPHLSRIVIAAPAGVRLRCGKRPEWKANAKSIRKKRTIHNKKNGPHNYVNADAPQQQWLMAWCVECIKDEIVSKELSNREAQ